MANEELWALQRLRVDDEGTFATEQSGSIGNFFDVRFREQPDFTPMVELLDDEATVQRRLQRREKIVGRRRVESLSISSDALPTGTALDSSASNPSSVNDATGVLLKNGLGGWVANKGTTENSGSSTASQTDVASSSEFTVGAPYAAKVNGSYEVRIAQATSTGTPDTITPHVQFSAAPDSGSEVLNSHAFYPTPDPNTTMQAIAESKAGSSDRTDIHWLLGLALNGLSMEFPQNQLARLNYELIGADWLHDDDVGTPLQTGSIGEASHNEGDPIPFLNSHVILADASGTVPYTRQTIDPTELSIEPNLSVAEVPAASGTNGIKRWRHTRPDGPFATASVTFPVTSDEFATFEDARDNRTQYTFSVQVNNVAGKMFYVALPTVQITGVERAGASDFAGITVQMEALDSRLTSGSTDIEQAPMVIGRL